MRALLLVLALGLTACVGPGQVDALGVYRVRCDGREFTFHGTRATVRDVTDACLAYEIEELR